MAFFVRSSKYRHVYGTCAKRDFCYDNVRVSANAWDTNMVKANPVSTQNIKNLFRYSYMFNSSLFL
jgi:hypothetical protein